MRPGMTEKLIIEQDTELGVYLPPCYAVGAGTRYPVLYLLPGFGGTSQDWFRAGIAEVADQAIHDGEVPPFIIVTTDDTYEDIGLDDILGGVIPYIESHYSVKAQRRFRAVAGGSLGGASAYLLVFQNPEVFASAGVFGNGLITGQEDVLRAWLRAIPSRLKPRVFLSSGESDTYMLEHARQLIAILDEADIAHVEVFGTGSHSYDTWVSSFPAYFRFLAADWR